MFAEQKSSGRKSNDSFGIDELCLLDLACYTFMDVPNSLKPLLMYKQETVCHSRWITTASGYLQFLSFRQAMRRGYDQTDTDSFLRRVCVCPKSMIHFKPKACDGPFLNLFQKDLVLVYQKSDEQVANMVFKYFVEHGSQWLSLKNVALGLFSDIPPLSLETEDFIVVACCYRYSCSDECRAARLKNFFTTQSQSAPRVTYSDIIPAILWKSIDNNNRATERRIRKLKNVIQDPVSDDNKNSRTDLRFAFLLIQGKCLQSFSDELCSIMLLMQLSIFTFRLEQKC